MKRALWDILVGLVLASLLGWGSWVTLQIFELSQYSAVQLAEAKTVNKSVEEMKSDIKTIDKKIEEQSKDMKNDQKEIYKLLLEIQKQIRKNERSK